MTAEQLVNKLFRTALLVDASLEWESGQSAKVALRHDKRPRQVDFAPVPRREMARLLESVMDDIQRTTLEQNGTVEFSHFPDEVGQGLKVTVFADSNHLHVAAHPLRWDDPPSGLTE